MRAPPGPWTSTWRACAKRSRTILPVPCISPRFTVQATGLQPRRKACRAMARRGQSGRIAGFVQQRLEHFRPMEYNWYVSCPVKPMIVQLMSFFHGRRSLLLLLCAFLLIGTSMFLVLPSESAGSTAPSAATGGGSSSHERRLATPAQQETPPAAIPASQRYLTLNPGDVFDFSPGPVSFYGHPALLSR